MRIPTIAVDSLDALLRNRDGLEGVDELWGVMDAYRGELFVAGQRQSSDGWAAPDILQPSTITSAAQWTAGFRERISECRQIGRKLAVVGTGLGRLKELVAECAGQSHVSVIPNRSPNAAEVALLGLELWKRGKTVDPFRLMPIYFRASAAEEKLRTNPGN